MLMMWPRLMAWTCYSPCGILVDARTCPRMDGRCAWKNEEGDLFVNSSDTAATMTQQELEQAIRSLSSADWVRLGKVSQVYSRPAISACDLLQEALFRALDGRRHCPVDVDTAKFLAEAMRSIANEMGVKEKTRGGAAVSIETLSDLADSPHSEQLDVEERLIEEDEAQGTRSSILALFDDDPTARDLVDGIMEEFTVEELMELTDLDRTAYDTKRRLIRRRLNKAYPNGWIR